MSKQFPAPRLLYAGGRLVRQEADQRAVKALQALGQDSRLGIFRLLLKHEPDGLVVGSIAEHLGAPQNTVSAHLAVLARAQLVASTRLSRSVCYRVDMEGLQWVVAYLLADCCGGDASKCEAIDALLNEVCCAPAAQPQSKAGKPKRRS